jgi:hypothetical protein
MVKAIPFRSGVVLREDTERLERKEGEDHDKGDKARSDGALHLSSDCLTVSGAEANMFTNKR